ncbi:MAG: protein-disulfide reductase DsbD domain-containing protein, partial [Roseimicrobium sp.]
FFVGLHLKHREHYHTYWKFPGIVGVPTQMAWQLPPGWRAEPIEWPEPERVFMFQIKAQGFHDEVLLPMKLTPPRELVPGTRVTLQGKATWMCCGRDCNPGFRDLALSLPVQTGPPSLDRTWSAAFERARATVAQPALGWRVRAQRSGQRVVLRLTPESAAAREALLELQEAASVTVQPSEPTVLFFTDDGYINADKPQQLRWHGGALELDLEFSTYFSEAAPPELRGVLQSKRGWRNGSLSRSIIIRAPFRDGSLPEG